MKIAIISANLGSYDRKAEWPIIMAPAGVSFDFHCFDDRNLPPRPLAMTSRLEAGIPKWWGWQMRPGYDAYIWIDASCAPNAHAVEFFLDHLGDNQIAAFQHPERRTIREEFDFMVARMARPGETYLNARYRGEWLREQYEYIAADHAYRDDRLYATTAFIYRPRPAIREAFQAVWVAKARWLLHDQLMFPYALHSRRCHVSVIEENYLKCEALRFARTGERRKA